MDKTFVGHQEVVERDQASGRLDAVVLFVALPFLLAPALFPVYASAGALALLLVPYGVRLMRGQRLSRPTAANLPVALLALVFLPLAFALSPAPWSISWPRVTTLAWSIALFFAVVNWSPPLGQGASLRTKINGPTSIFLTLGVGVAVVGLLGMQSVDKLFFVAQTGFLADALGWESGLPTNEIAGVLTLFVPFFAALTYGCLITERWRQFGLLLPATLLLLATLALTQSRTGLAATAAGTMLALVISSPITRRRVAAGLALAGVALLVIGLTPLREWFVFAGANSWDSVIGPRLGIWGQSLDGIRDHPLWGMGLGVFGPLARWVYPLVTPEAGPVLEDAHNLYLQTALDFGLAGALVFLVVAGIVAVSAVRLVRARPPRTLARLWAAGLLGGLAAHALYSLTDAVALGTLAGIPLWFLFGLVLSATRARLRLEWSKAGRLLFAGGLVLAVLVPVLGLPVNRAGQLAVRAFLEPVERRAETAAIIDRSAAGSCRARWYAGLAYHAASDSDGRAAAWSGLLECTDNYTGYMAALVAGDAALAQQAITAQPGDAAGYFWLASALADAAPDEAIARYRQGLTLSPGDGRRWLELADLLRPRDTTAALDAYLQACLNGDPGANGCLRAGSLAAEQGDPQRAIEYYRLSKFGGALAEADELERQLADD